ncbi:asparagine synthase (glutamine-hydrolyzing) [Sphingomonas sp. BN140010]|uniref:asparagine synthase (glutamine-hydrolyzing) n=1 Tax=Sphingomonas arvum TaxID=2992113 RepID=A0ABT3JDH7_9SPHN|nr:asparagine synthase (glutamine-hydrolyzing) [Sphingomonas sp. BN140010]MCW3797069.1 asparagine synthase (glutamine-hydrolyzing) [Sphingomonas sp. BN140010]
MCGIAGILSSGEPASRLLEAMGGALRHRGPDEGATWHDPEAGIGLSHRRLSIVDLSPHGHQPMRSADGRWVLCYNGEIYNHAAIRRELEGEGRGPPGGWRGHSDTETLLQAIAAWGLEGALDRAAGMFAFALWDARERRLHLVRDRFGEKPLYYGWCGRDFVFASELKAIRAHPDFRAEIDRQSLALFAQRNVVPAPHSIYRGLFKLSPGCVLTIDRTAAGHSRVEPPHEGVTDRGLHLTRYWDYRSVIRRGIANPIEDSGGALRELDRVLGQAVADQAVADVPVGAFLSGGIDSSAIVALLRQHSTQPVRTFTIGFSEPGYDESPHARAVAEHLGTVHHQQIVAPADAREVIPLLPTIYDEPFADSSQIPTFLVSRFARGAVTVALTGDGGDELFGGYNRHVQAPRLWAQFRRIPLSLRAAAAAALGQVPSAWWTSAGALLPGTRQPHFGAKLQKLLQVAGRAHSLDDVYRDYLDEWPCGPPVRGETATLDKQVDLDDLAPDAARLMARDALGYLPDDILCKVDRASMAVSLETRVPFLDHRVAELAARIPLSLKIENGRGKLVLRQLLARHVPTALVDRPKTGFGIPIGEWLKGPLRDWAEDLLDPATLRTQGWFDHHRVERRWRDHLSGTRDSTPAIWSILMFQAWLRSRDA